MESKIFVAALAISFISLNTYTQTRIYRSGGSEIILSGADIKIAPTGLAPVDVNNNMRFTLFFHLQQFINLDLGSKVGLYTGAAIRNVGLIQNDLYQYMGFTGIDNTHRNWNKSTVIKRRSYSLGFPLALKLGNLDDFYFIYAGGEIEWMFHYKQKQFIDGNKTIYTEWGSKRVNPWNPSVFAGVQFPGGLNLKLKYYMNDFLNTNLQGIDFGEQVDYGQFQSTGIWYISIAIVINKYQLKKMMDSQGFDKSAYRH